MSLLKKFVEFLNTVKDTTSNNEKIDIIRSIQSDEEVVSLLMMILDKNKPFHVKSGHLLKRAKTNPGGIPHKMTLPSLLVALSERNISGNEALDKVNYFITKNSDYSEDLLKIFDKKLNARITRTTLDKAFTLAGDDDGGSPFKIALGENLTPAITEKIQFSDFLVSRKLDGVRCVTIIRSPTDIKTFSRQSKEFTTTDVIKGSIRFTGPMVLDGEITVDNGSDNFKGVMQIIRKKEPMVNCLYNVFDILTIEEFMSGKGSVTLTERLKRPLIITNENIVSIVKQYPSSKMAELKTTVTRLGWEGLIMRKDVGYIGKRSKDILKVKEFNTGEFKVVGVESGVVQELVGGSFQDTVALKHVVIELANGITTNVGSGFTIQERKEYHENPEKIIGKTIGVQYFSVQESGKLRFPTFLINYGNSRDI